MISYLSMPTKFWVNYCVVFEKLIARNMLSLDHLSHGKRRLTTQNMLSQCLRICQKFMTAFLLIYWFLNWKHTVWIKLVYICWEITSVMGNQRVRIGSSFFSDWWDIICGIPQVDMVFFVSKLDICNFADDKVLVGKCSVIYCIISSLI